MAETAGVAGVLAALYGWYQYYAIPDWDAFWVKEVGFVGYLGKLEPSRLRLFDVCRRGVCAAYMGLVAIPMLVSERWKVGFGLPEAILVVVLYIHYVWPAAAASWRCWECYFSYPEQRKKLRRIGIISALACSSCSPASSKSGEQIESWRAFRRLLQLTDDDSFQGRMNNAKTCRCS